MSASVATKRHARHSQPVLRVSIIWTVVAGLTALRLINALSIQTFFQPDEYFQALEPAWLSTFGPTSGAWITWEWREHLRSSIHPRLFAAAYAAAFLVANLFRVSLPVQSQFLLAAPKILQAFFAAAGDFNTWRLACKLYGPASPASWAALALTVCSPWQWYCAPRTFSNSLETSLTITALAIWPWHFFLAVPEKPEKPEAKQANWTAVKSVTRSLANFNSELPKGLYLSLSLAAAACLLRPTNIIIWMTVACCLLINHGTLGKALALAKGIVTSGTSTLVVSLAMDWQFYGVLVFPPLKFLYLNVVQSISIFYGRNRHDYYFTEGLPPLMTTALPFAVVGLWSSLRPGPDRPSSRGHEVQQTEFVLGAAVLVTVITMSLISHKEVRFIYPLLPLLHILASKSLARFFEPFPLPKKTLRLCLLGLMLVVNIAIAAYVTLVHQRGVIDVMHHLRHEYESGYARTASEGTPRVNMTVGFLMPCHSTPWRSHLIHPGIDAWALSCEPPLNVLPEHRESYKDVADAFYSDPAAWLRIAMKSPLGAEIEKNESEMSLLDGLRRAWPLYLVFFEHLEPVLDSASLRNVYEECWRAFNTHWHDDPRRQGDVIVWCMQDQYAPMIARDDPNAGENVEA